MSNVIDFLEALARDGGPEAHSPQRYAAAVAALDIDESLRDALLRRDAAALGRLLGARHNVMMILVPAEDEPTPNKQPVPDDDKDKVQARAGRG
jgi:hypothetical protein